MLRNAVSCTKPGYTRRMKPGCGSGTWLMRFFSNHSMGRSLASLLTPVGLTRQSTGPAIRVSVRGCAGWSSSAISATAASAATHGWQTATTCTGWPAWVCTASMNFIMCSM